MSAPDLVRSFSSAYSDCEPWKADHDDAMACRTAEANIVYGLNLLEQILASRKRWVEQVENAPQFFSWKKAKEFDDALRWWLVCSETVNKMIRESKSKEYFVERAEEFQKLFDDVSQMQLDTDATQGAIEALESGSGKRHSEVMSELRSRLRPSDR